MCLFVPLLRSFPLLVPFSALYGYFDGAYVALIPVVTSDLVGTRYLSSALGVVYFLHAVPYLLSPPIGGEEGGVRRGGEEGERDLADCGEEAFFCFQFFTGHHSHQNTRRSINLYVSR